MPTIADARVYSAGDYYVILGVPNNVSDEYIKKNFIRLALKFHPDKLGRPATASDLARFVDIKDAYEILSNPNTRAVYDQYRLSIFGEASVNAPTFLATAYIYNEDVLDPKSKQYILAAITAAVFNKDIERLKELLVEYRALNITASEQAKDITYFNWLLRNVAYVKPNELATIDLSNQTAMLLLDFGADANHYDSILRDDGKTLFKCYFVEMLMFYNNFSLFKTMHEQNKFHFANFIISAQPFDNIDNKFVNFSKYSKLEYRTHERENKEKRTRRQRFELHLSGRLLMLSMFCHWLIKHDSSHLLQELRNLKPKLNTRESDIEKSYRRAYQWHNSCCSIFVHPNTTEYIVSKYQNAIGSHYKRLALTAYNMQYMVDMILFNAGFVSLNFRINLQDGMEEFSVLFQAHNNNTAVRMLNRLQWQIKYDTFYTVAVLMSFISGIITIAVPGSFEQLIVGAVLTAPFAANVLTMPCLALLRPLCLGVYDVHSDISTTMLSAYTNSLLMDVVRNAKQPVQAPNASLIFSNRSKVTHTDGFQNIDLEDQPPRSLSALQLA